ncbi:MAG: PEP/pyruvate-binding domain-containing protein [Desulfotignum sp.]|nr:PEP/pyruvate-binding domain-containing protein [Desulfotignum sp.]
MLSQIKKEVPDLPFLIISTEERSRDLAYQIPAVFINKNSVNLNDRIKIFFVGCLGFGAFVFRRPDGEEVARASDLRAIEKLLPEIPDESIVFHAKNNDFSRWLLARSEISLALNLKPYTIDDFPNPKSLKRFLIDSIRARRRGTRQGQVIEFDSKQFDSDTGFMKIGNGSLGGKARGLAFMASQIKQDNELIQKFPDVDIHIPQTFVIATDGFKMFIEDNNLAQLLDSDRNLSDDMVVKAFIQARFPDWLKNNLKVYLEHVTYPIAVRSSSLFEDAHYQPFAGLYKTYMLPNSDSSLDTRLERLIMAVKLVYASTYMNAPRAYAQSTMHRTEDEEMAVILQQLTGIRHDNYLYPSIAGVAQSYNFYPIAHLKAEEGIAYIAMGLGKIVMEGGKNPPVLSPISPVSPQFSMVEDILENAQKYFYALKMDVFPSEKSVFFRSRRRPHTGQTGPHGCCGSSHGSAVMLHVPCSGQPDPGCVLQQGVSGADLCRHPEVQQFSAGGHPGGSHPYRFPVDGIVRGSRICREPARGRQPETGILSASDPAHGAVQAESHRQNHGYGSGQGILFFGSLSGERGIQKHSRSDLCGPGTFRPGKYSRDRR